jgi:putative RecB family exonuclease
MDAGAPTTPAAAERSPAERLSTPVDGVRVLASLSPSRAGDFMACPLRYRFRVVDRLPERPSADAARGSLVHRVLELLFDHPAALRTPERAAAMLVPVWRELLAQEPALAGLFPAPGAGGQQDDAQDDAEGDVQGRWLAGCARVLDRWFELEDPRRLEPAEREAYVETLLEPGLLLRGFVDRLDVAPDGRVRVVDYKTGRAPDPRYEAQALFQMKFYALVLWRARGVVPSVLQLVYLGDGQVLRHEPDEAELLATERKVLAVWEAIREAERSGDWRPRRGPLCAWCDHQALCPEFGGSPPPLPVLLDGRPVDLGSAPDPAQTVTASSGDTSLGLISPEAISSA